MQFDAVQDDVSKTQVADSPDKTNFPYERREIPRKSGCGIVEVLRCECADHTDADSADWRLHDSKLRGLLLDLNKNGVAFILPEQLETNETVHLRIYNPRTERHSLISARCVQSTPMQLNNHRISCEFTSKMTLETLYEISHAVT